MTTNPKQNAHDNLRWEIARTLWGSHEQAAACSHRPEDVRRLFCDANASHQFAEALMTGPLAPVLTELDRLRAEVDTLRFNLHECKSTLTVILADPPTRPTRDDTPHGMVPAPPEHEIEAW